MDSERPPKAEADRSGDPPQGTQRRREAFPALRGKGFTPESPRQRDCLPCLLPLPFDCLRVRWPLGEGNANRPGAL